MFITCFILMNSYVCMYTTFEKPESIPIELKSNGHGLVLSRWIVWLPIAWPIRFECQLQNVAPNQRVYFKCEILSSTLSSLSYHPWWPAHILYSRIEWCFVKWPIEMVTDYLFPWPRHRKSFINLFCKHTTHKHRQADREHFKSNSVVRHALNWKLYSKILKSF